MISNFKGLHWDEKNLFILHKPKFDSSAEMKECCNFNFWCSRVSSTEKPYSVPSLL